ncbi:MAG: cytochrome B5 [Spirochaetes bacterium]|nr:MAG: cytochrome B5 [Spirochaetota bacterium]
MSVLREFTIEELSLFDGKNGRPTYIAYKGMVYDVSESFLWRGGKHQALHFAGKDLTEDLKQAPHCEELLERVKIVGILKK